MTLAETLMYCALFGFLMSVAGRIVVTAYADTVGYGNRQDDFRNASAALDDVCRYLAQCQQIYAPDINSAFTDGSSCAPTAASPLVFAYTAPSAGGPQWRSYYLDQNVLYTVPYATSVAQPAIPLARNISTFEVTRPLRASRHNVVFLTVDLHVSDGQAQYDLEREVRTPTLGAGW
jgi:hypothetical protein